VFEVQSSSLGAQSALCGGGRYDDLVKELGGPPTPAVGVGIGIERLMIALEAEGVSMTPQHPDAFFAYAGSEHRPYALEIARSLRRAGFSVLVPPDAVSLKSQLKQADRSGARFTLIVGEEEAGKGVVTVRRMSTGEQQTVPYAQLKEVLA
jgi:histidyl-tRNA synthetase